MTTTTAPQMYRAWDPLAAPYVTRPCRAAAHDHCPGTLAYYPTGMAGDSVDVRCSCNQTGCRCTAAATMGEWSR